MIDKSLAPNPPEGYELIWEGKYIKGDLFWSTTSKNWLPIKIRIGHSVNMYMNPPARPKPIGTETTEATEEELNHLFGIKSKDLPKTTIEDHW